MTKQEIINLRWIELVGEENFPKLRLNDRGESDWRCRQLLPAHNWDLLSDRIGNYKGKHPSGRDLLFRPKSLKGIETNNGWNKISVDGMPKKVGYYTFIDNQIKSESNFWFDETITIPLRFTHWREVIEIPKPLY